MSHLPLFPALCAPLTEDGIERVAEWLMNKADRVLLSGKATQDEYDRWCRALDCWTTSLFAQVVS